MSYMSGEFCLDWIVVLGQSCLAFGQFGIVAPQIFGVNDELGIVEAKVLRLIQIYVLLWSMFVNKVLLGNERTLLWHLVGVDDIKNICI